MRAFLIVIVLALSALAADSKLRIAVLTDIENEPDDTQSMVRFLTYSNHWDVEALIATTSVHLKDRVAPDKIRELVRAYGEVRANLLLHEPGYPTAEQLLSVVKESKPLYGMTGVGPGKDSPGSDHLIALVDKDDPRPLWITIWGGPNCLAQALWKVRATRSAAELDRFVAKLRVYTISDQDDSGPWLRQTFPKLFYIASPGMSAGGAYHHSTWSGISGDNFHGRFTGPDFSIVDNPWLDRNIRSQGPLGKLYPITKYLMEGDTPTFLYLINNGLSVPEHPDLGSWGGRYEFYTPRTRKWFIQPETRPFWTDTEDEVQTPDGRWYSGNKVTIWRWRNAYQNDFAARMAWTVQPYAKANHPPVPKLGHPAQLSAKSGERVVLSAEGSSDPDGNALSYEWICYWEAGSYSANRLLQLENPRQQKATFVAPKVTQPETIQLVLAVTDQGAPALTRYQRVVVTVSP